MNSILQEDYARLADRLGTLVHRFEGAHMVITGAAGFIGSYLSGFLNYLNTRVLGRRVTADLLDSFVAAHKQPAAAGELCVRRVDVSKRFRLERQPDYIIHAAGIASPVYYSKMPVKTLEAGTTGTRRMLELARTSRCRSMLFLSSSEIYGDPDREHLPTTETYNGNVSTSGSRACYDESKRMGETWSFLYACRFDVPVNVVRPFNIYGPGFRRSDGRVIPNFVESLAAKRPLIVHGHGQHTRTFCYIADGVEALWRVLFGECRGEAFNVGCDEPEISIRELAEMMCGLMPEHASLTFSEPELSAYALADPARRCPDISKLSAYTGFRPHYSLADGLRRTVQWYWEQHGLDQSAVRLDCQAV